MLFPTIDFALFFAVVFLGHWLLNPKPLPWKLFMIGASYFFYAWWNPSSSAVGRDLAPVAARRARGEPAGPGAGSPVDHGDRGGADDRTTAYFKYYGFFSVNVTNASSSLGLHLSPPLIQLILPVGISFFTFMGIALHRRRLPSPIRDGVVDRRIPLPLVLPAPGRRPDRAAR